MAESRGRKGKKAAWQLNLSVKETFFAALAVAGLMMISFALGALAGRGDIYRAASRWGLMAQEPPSVAQLMVSPPTSPAAPIQGAVAPVGPPAAPAAAAPSPPPAPGAAASTGAPPAKKAAKAAPVFHKHKEEELRKLREEMARKLKFQNSLDTGSPKIAHKSGKHKPKTEEKAAPAKAAAPAAAVKVGQFRDKKAAQAKLAELHRRGEKASLKEGKDQNGVYYAVYRQPNAAAPQKSTAGSAPSGAKPKAKKPVE